jgi:hypothetical protein
MAGAKQITKTKNGGNGQGKKRDRSRLTNTAVTAGAAVAVILAMKFCGKEPASEGPRDCPERPDASVKAVPEPVEVRVPEECPGKVCKESVVDRLLDDYCSNDSWDKNLEVRIFQRQGTNSFPEKLDQSEVVVLFTETRDDKGVYSITGRYDSEKGFVGAGDDEHPHYKVGCPEDARYKGRGRRRAQPEPEPEPTPKRVIRPEPEPESRREKISRCSNTARVNNSFGGLIRSVAKRNHAVLSEKNPGRDTVYFHLRVDQNGRVQCTDAAGLNPGTVNAKISSTRLTLPDAPCNAYIRYPIR